MSPVGKQTLRTSLPEKTDPNPGSLLAERRYGVKVPLGNSSFRSGLLLEQHAIVNAVANVSVRGTLPLTGRHPLSNGTGRVQFACERLRRRYVRTSTV